MIHDLKIGFIGAGNMAQCLISGLIASEYPAKHIWAANPSEGKLLDLHNQYGVNINSNNNEVAEIVDVLVLSVKPQILKQVAQELAAVIKIHKPLVISVAVGISLENLEKWIGHDIAIARAMPNLPALIGSAMTILCANKNTSPAQRDFVGTMLNAVGASMWLEKEALMDVASALAASGPAYFFYMMEALEQAAVDNGLSKADAHLLILQTALGSSRLALSTEESLVDLRKRVTSKGGITEQALHVLEQTNTRDIFARALVAAKNRAAEITKQYG